MPPYSIRPMLPEDIELLADIRPGFITDTILKIERLGQGLEQGWRLVETKLATPYEKGAGYDFTPEERQNIAERLAQNNTLMEVAVEKNTGKIVGVLDVEEELWRNTVWIWNIMLDVDARGQGIGREMIQHTISWGRRRGLRAILLETQTNNVPACKFYLRMGFQLAGINTAFYTNQDMERDEIALFWVFPLRPR
ncbi:MAG: GNAT family N-acetyltransferase [Chloroflexi bacterium]|nr:GNAT family N-acetyltransferase [Chloroflexota bacterium]